MNFDSIGQKNFDEEAYLDANPDVARAVRKNSFRSGYHHYIAHGVHEGRPLQKKPNRKELMVPRCFKWVGQI